MWGRRAAGPVVLVVLAVLAGAGPACASGYTTPASAGSFTQVGAGRANVCALKADGTLLCWGSDGHGESTPPAGTFTALSVGDDHACAIRTDQTLACWGDAASGMIAAPAGTFTALSAGFDHSCAVRTDQTLACWGALNGLPPAGTFASVSAVNGNDCALRTDATVACWGHDTWGEGTPPAATTFTAVSANWSFGCGLKTDAALACWGLDSGANHYGQTLPPAGAFLAVGTSAQDTACAIRADQALTCWGELAATSFLPPAGRFTALSVGTFFACAVAVDETVSCWGSGVPQGPVDPPPVVPGVPVVVPVVPVTHATPPATTTTTKPVPTPTPTPTVPAKPARISAASAFTLPAATHCVSRRHFTIRIRKLRGVTFVSAVVKVDGKRVKTIKRARITAPVDLTGLPKGRFTVAITAKASDGRTVTGTRTYRTCAPKHASSGPTL
jgi:hypothetical protein